jgi:anthranilate phosphoribosyltransferase
VARDDHPSGGARPPVGSATAEPAEATTRDFTWQPEDFGIKTQPLDGLAVQTPAASAEVIRDILNGQRGPARDLVLLNAAAGLIAAERESDPRAAAAFAADAIDSGAAKALLQRLVELSHRVA